MCLGYARFYSFGTNYDVPVKGKKLRGEIRWERKELHKISSRKSRGGLIRAKETASGTILNFPRGNPELDPLTLGSLATESVEMRAPERRPGGRCL